MARSLRIALFTPTFLPKFCGAEVVHHNLAMELLAQGHSPVVVTSSRLVRQLKKSGTELPYPVEAYPGRILRWAEERPRLVGWVAGLFFGILQRRHRFDVWHVSNAFPSGVLCIPWARRAGVPVLVRSEGEDVQRDATIHYGLRLRSGVDAAIRKTLPLADCCVAITHDIEEAYLEIGVPREKIRLLPNGVRLATFDIHPDKAAVRRRHGLPEDKFLFLCVSRNHPKKGFAYLLEAARILHERRKDFAVVVAGRGNSAWLPRVRELGLEGVVFPLEELGAEAGEWQAPGRGLAELYKSSDAFVFPSLMEAFGMVLVEAMAADLPIITTSAPGCCEVVRDGEDALMVPPSDAVALAGAMARFLDQPGEREEWRKKAVRRAAEFDWAGITRLYVAEYERMADMAPTSSSSQSSS